MNKFFKNQISREILISLAVITAYHLLGKVPLPFINMVELNALSISFGSYLLGGNFFGNFSIVALGIMPFASAYIMVEICSLFIPFLKKHRGGDYYGRKVLKKYALILTFFLSAIQGKFIIKGLEGMLSPSGIPILALSNNLQFYALLFSLVATVFISLYLAEIATKHGIGNGISLLILSGTSFGIFGNISMFFGHTSKIPQNFFYVILLSIIIFFSFVFISIFLLKTSCSIQLKHNSDQSSTNYFKLSSCLSGKVAIGYATSLLMIPVTFISFMESFKSLASSLAPGTLVYHFFSCVFVILLSYLFGWLFIHPERRFKTLKSWGWNVEETSQYSIDFIKHNFFFMNLPWSLFLCAVIILPSILITAFNSPFYLGGSSFFVLSFLSLDIGSRLKLWNENVHEKLFKVAEFQDLHHATMIKNHLKSENIKFYLQGYYHRHLLYFLGPYIPINLMIPTFERKQVTEIIDRYYGGLGLIENENKVQQSHSH